MTEIKWVVFDFDEVISRSLKWFQILLKEINEKVPLDQEKGLEHLKSVGRDWFTHVIDEEWVHKDLCKALDVDIPFEIFDDAFHHTILPNPDMIQVMRSLKNKGYKLGLLTDSPRHRIMKIAQHHELGELFDHASGAGVLQKFKRDPSVFTDLAKELGIEPGECLFIDDNDYKVENARSVGMKAHNFVLEDHTIEQLLAGLKLQGINL